MRSHCLRLCLRGVYLGGVHRARGAAPATVLGHTPEDDFHRATCEESRKHFHTLAAASARMKVITGGKMTPSFDKAIAKQFHVQSQAAPLV